MRAQWLHSMVIVITIVQSSQARADFELTSRPCLDVSKPRSHAARSLLALSTKLERTMSAQHAFLYDDGTTHDADAAEQKAALELCESAPSISW